MQYLMVLFKTRQTSLNQLITSEYTELFLPGHFNSMHYELIGPWDIWTQFEVTNF